MAAKAMQAEETSGGVVDLAKVNRKHLVGVIEGLGVKTKSLEPADLVAALQKHYADNKVEVVSCDVCGGDSDEELDACPYCGISDKDQKPAEPAAKETNVQQQEVTSPKKDKKAPKPTAEKTAKTAKVDKKKANGKAEPATEVTTTALVVPAPAKIEKYVAKDLDAAVSLVQALKSDTSVSMWRLGGALKDIFDKQLWKQRKGEDSTQKYKSFDQFCVDEIGMTYKNVDRLMRVAANFSEEMVRQFGTRKLSLVLEAPEKDRQAIIEEKLATGATKRQVEEAVRESRQKSGVQPSPQTAAATEAAARKREEAREEKKAAAEPSASGRLRKSEVITISSLTGRTSVKLFARGSDEKRAKKLADEPWGQHELENGVVQKFSVAQSPTGELVLIIKTTRPEAK